MGVLAVLVLVAGISVVVVIKALTGDGGRIISAVITARDIETATTLMTIHCTRGARDIGNVGTAYKRSTMVHTTLFHHPISCNVMKSLRKYINTFRHAFSGIVWSKIYQIHNSVWILGIIYDIVCSNQLVSNSYKQDCPFYFI